MKLFFIITALKQDELVFVSNSIFQPNLVFVCDQGAKAPL